MAEASGSEAAQAATSETTPNPNVSTTPSGDGANSQAENAEQAQAASSSQEELVSKSELKKVRNEAQNLRDRMHQLEEKNKALEDAKLSEEERRQKRLNELEAEHTELKTKHQSVVTEYAVSIEAQKRGIIDPEAASILLDKSRIEYDANDKPTNIGDLLDELLQNKPYLKGKPEKVVASAGSATNPPTHSPSDPNSHNVSQKFSYKEWRENKDAIIESLRQGTLT